MNLSSHGAGQRFDNVQFRTARVVQRSMLEGLVTGVRPGSQIVLVWSDAAGAGVSHLASQLEEAAEASGRTVTVLQGRTPDVSNALATAGLSTTVSVSDVRVVRLAAFSVNDARRVLYEHGFDPWSIRSGWLVKQHGATPRELLDAAFGGEQPDWSRDRTFAMLAEYPLICAWYRSWCDADDHSRREISRRARGSSSVEGLTVRALEALVNEDLEQVIQLSAQAQALPQSSDNDRLTMHAAVVGAAARALRGEAEGLESLHSLVAHAERMEYRDIEVRAWHFIGMSFLREESHGAARHAIVRSMTLADEHELLTYAVLLRSQRAALLMADGYAQAATVCLEEMANEINDGQCELAWIHTSLELISARLNAADNFAARALSEELLGRVPSGVYPAIALEVRIVVSRARASTGDIEGALHLLGTPSDYREARDRSGTGWLVVLQAIRLIARHELTNRPLMGWLRLLQSWEVGGTSTAIRAAVAEADAWVCLRDGDSERARMRYEQARDAWTELGAHNEIAQISDLGDRIDVISSRPTTITGVLTQREREVALLLSAGLTNNEMAAELRLSVRTVEHHVASVLRKLGLHGRRELRGVDILAG